MLIMKVSRSSTQRFLMCHALVDLRHCFESVFEFLTPSTLGSFSGIQLCGQHR